VPDQVLIVTKALGSGVLLAANMRGRLSAGSLEALIGSLDNSNAAAVEILVDCGATALTDVSGFGFAGHLAEMLRASQVGADISIENLPALPQALELFEQGISSSLQQNNLQALADFEGGEGTDARRQLLADPQTAGGLLAGIPRERVPECLARLREAGYPAAAEVGTVTRDHARLVG
jgi:selenide, water dikinase